MLDGLRTPDLSEAQGNWGHGPVRGYGARQVQGTFDGVRDREWRTE